MAGLVSCVGILLWLSGAYLIQCTNHLTLHCLQVYLPSALTGGPNSSDPKVRELNNELNEVNRKILNNDLEIPPEGERSPSPEPIYDRNGECLWHCNCYNTPQMSSTCCVTASLAY